MNPDEKQLLERGRAAYESADYPVAEKCFTELLRLHQDWPELFGKLGAIFHHQGRFTDAVKLYAHALQLNPQYTEARLNLAVLLNDMGRYKHAAKLVEKMSTVIPYPGRLGMGNLANSHIATGDAYFALQLFNHARAEYENAAKLRPGWPDLKYKLGITYRRLGRNQDAIRELEAAVKIFDNDPNLHSELALSRYQAGDRRGAVDAWEAVLTRWPDFQSASRYLEMAREEKEAAISAA